MSLLTYINDKGFPVYRRGPNDTRTVPHNREILLDWWGHACLEYSGTVHHIFYLCSYIYKVNKKVKMNVNDPNGTQIRQDDEIYQYVIGQNSST